MVINYLKFDYYVLVERMDYLKLLIVIIFGVLRICRVNLLEMLVGSFGYIFYVLSKFFFWYIVLFLK